MDIIQYLIGAEYREGLHVIPYLLFAFIFLGLYYNFSIWYKLSDHTRIGAIISVIGMVIMVSINFIWLPKIGYIASAYAALTCYGFMAVAGWATGQRYYPIHYPIIKILNYILTAAIIIIALTWLRHNTNYPIWLIGTISLLFYIGNTYIKDGTYIRSLFAKDQV
jgi:O-antigen/teichoic acid export membrane protein